MEREEGERRGGEGKGGTLMGGKRRGAMEMKGMGWTLPSCKKSCGRSWSAYLSGRCQRCVGIRVTAEWT